MARQPQCNLECCWMLSQACHLPPEQKHQKGTATKPGCGASGFNMLTMEMQPEAPHFQVGEEGVIYLSLE